MRTIRLAILGDSPCGRCTAKCCKQNGHDYAVLLRGDEVRKFAPWATGAAIRSNGHPIVERVLPYINGRCPFLGDDDRCTIYGDRPSACREFQCVSMYNRDGINQHAEFLRRNPSVRVMLEQL